MKVLVVVAHPDDETFGCGSLIADAAERGHEVVVCCATRGEAGEPRPRSMPEVSDLAAVREAELHEAASLLGTTRVCLLDFEDSGWDGPTPDMTLCGAPTAAVVTQVAAVLADVRPDVVVTLDPSGGDPHRDHTRIAEATILAFDAAVRRVEVPPDGRLYCWTLVRSLMVRWLAHHQGSVYDEAPEDATGRPDHEVTTVVDVADLVPLRLEAIACHRSQVSPYEGLPDELAEAFLATDRLVRVRPPWTGGPLESTILGPAVSP